MMVKVSAESLAAIGASNAAEFNEKLAAFISKAQQNESVMAEKQVTLESLQATVTALEGKILSEDRVKAIVNEAVAPAATKSVSDWAASEAGKKIIGAEASRITLEAIASVGTVPVKPAPNGNPDPAAASKGLIAEGKFEEAWAIDKNLQAEFPTAKVYAAYAKAEAEGRVNIGKSK